MAIDYHRRIPARRRAAPGAGAVTWPRRLLAFLLGSDMGDRGARESSATAEFEFDPALVGPDPRRFPVVRQGYERLAVDEYIRELENELADTDRELAEARSRVDAAREVQTEFRRIGEQISAVLIAAHEQRDVILHEARAEAQSSVAEAAARAQALVAEGEARGRELEAQNEAARRERDRLLEELRSVSASLAAVADSVQERVAAPN